MQAPANFLAANNLVLVMAEQAEEAKRQQALELAELNANKYAQNPEVWSTLAWVYFRLERYNEAERAMERALAARALNPDSAYFLGTMLERRGKLQDAQALLEKALETPEAFAYRAEAAKLLAKLKQEISAPVISDSGPKTSADDADTAPVSPKASAKPKIAPKGKS